MIYPKALPNGGRIGVVFPSSRGDIGFENDIILSERGFDVWRHAQCEAVDRQSAGTADVRAQAVMDVFADESVDAILCGRGGNRVMHILPKLDYGVIAKNPKPIIGFSDATALLNAIYAKTGLVTYHGPTLSKLAKLSSDQIDQMVSTMQGQGSLLPVGEAVKGGVAHGRLIGGNLSLVAAMVGTPYMPDTRGAILFLEDVGDQLSRYDRMLMQLRLAGILDEVAGIAFGAMDVSGDNGLTPFGFTLNDIIAEHTAHLTIPVVTGAPFGHTGALFTLPVGGDAVLDADNLTLTIKDAR